MASYIGTRRFIRTKGHLITAIIFICLSLLPTYFLLQPVEFAYTASDRLAVPGHNSNFTGYIVAGALMVIAMFIYAFGITMSKMTALLPFVMLALFILFLLGTRGATLSVGMFTVVFLIGKYLPRRAVILILLLACLIAISVTFGVFDAIMLAVDHFSDRSTGDLSGRTVLWKLAIERFLNSPLIGNGFGSSSKLGEGGVATHNFFLTVLSETGLVGFVLVSAFTVAWAKEIIRNIDNGRAILLLFAAYWLPIATSGQWELTPYSWFVVGLTSQVSRIDRRYMTAVDEPINRPVTNLVTSKESGRRNLFV